LHRASGIIDHNRKKKSNEKTQKEKNKKADMPEFLFKEFTPEKARS
jgi:hypothetical protein